MVEQLLSQVELDPCLRSGVDYAHLVAQALDVTTFRDVTCSSAETDNILTTPTTGLLPADTQPPQIDAVTSRTSLVTITIGGNDAGLVGIAYGCLNLLPPPIGQSCAAQDTAGGVDIGAQDVDAVGPKLATVLDAVHHKVPHASILITSYTDYVQHDGCYPLQPFLPEDANYLQGLVDRLGALTQRIAKQHHATYVDLITPAQGHDGCQLTQN